MYDLDGTFLQACSCRVLCPSWVGEDPDGGECFGIHAYLLRAGEIDGVDVSGLSLLKAVHMPGNAMTPASWEVVMLIDDQASTRQRDAIVGAFMGAEGGPLAGVAGLIRRTKAVASVPIVSRVSDGTAVVQVPGKIELAIEPYRGLDGSIPMLTSPLLPGTGRGPARLARAPRHRVSLPEYGMAWEFEGRGAIDADWAVAHEAAALPHVVLA